jgi:hypothetical protein
MAKPSKKAPAKAPTKAQKEAIHAAETSHAPKPLKDKEIVPAWDILIIDNDVVIKDREAFQKHLIPLEGRENYQLIIKRKVKGRSRQEEKFYHAVPVKFVAEAMDITRDEAHEFLKALLLKVEESILLPDGSAVRYERIMSTTELGDKAYREYWEDVIRWAALPTDDNGLSRTSGLGIYIPMPNEVEWQGRDEYIVG